MEGDLLELAARCGKAEGPDRELDILIHNATRTSRKWFHGDDYRPRNAKLFTTSIDAAMTLVPEGWDSVDIRRTDDLEWHVGLAGNDMHMMAEDPDEFYVEAASCMTAALAICAAALRARASHAP